MDHNRTQNVLEAICKLTDELAETKAENARLREENTRLREIADSRQMDELTGLYGRRWLRHFWDGHDAPWRELSAIIVIDVDDFKQVNDQHGHNAGDAVLVHVAKAIRANCAYAVRTGGDEFIALIGRDHNPRSAADGMAATAARSTEFEDKSIRVSISVGICHIAPWDRNLSQMIDIADQEMYAAKRASRSTCKARMARV